MSRRTCALFGFLLLLGELLAAQADPFERGVQSYRRGDYAEARLLWNEALTDDLDDASRARVLYDQGNAAFRAGDELEAAAWYTACLRVAPRHPDAWANLEFSRLEAGLDPADRGDLSSTVGRLVRSLRPDEARRLVWYTLGLFALALILEVVRGGALWRWVSIACFFLLLVALVPWSRPFFETEGDPHMVIRSGGSGLRSEPRVEMTTIASVAAGDVVERIDELPGWVRVETDEKKRGWIKDTAVFALRR